MSSSSQFNQALRSSQKLLKKGNESCPKFYISFMNNCTQNLVGMLSGEHTLMNKLSDELSDVSDMTD